MKSTKLFNIATLSVLLFASCGSIQQDIVSNTYDFSTEIQDDASREVYLQLQKFENASSVVLTFARSTYHFYPEHAQEEFCHISNHNDVLTTIAFSLKNKKHVVIDGQGSTFIFHGRMIPFNLEHCKDITIKNLTIDYSESFHSEGTIVAHHADNSFDMRISDEYPYEIRNGQLIFVKPYYEHGLGESILYDPKTKAIRYQTEHYTPLTVFAKAQTSTVKKGFTYKYKTDNKDAFIRNQGKQYGLEVKEVEPGLVRISKHRKGIPPIGSILVSKGFNFDNRIAPAFRVSDSENVTMQNVHVNHAGGMGFLFENSKDLLLENCVIEPSNGRMVSTAADATHFVGCRGKVTLRDCIFHNQLDDAMNVHGVYQEVMDKIDEYTVGVRVGHFQQLGFQLAKPSDKIGLVRLADSFHAYHTLTVKSSKMVNGRYHLIEFNEKLPDSLQTGDLLENLSAYPEVLVEGCDISRNRARGLLISTPRSTIVRNNYFSTEMEAILMPVESSSWFESGNAANVVIENNVFQDCTIGGMDRGVICFRTDSKNKNIAFSNVVVKNNTFNQYDNLILQVKNIDGFTFEGNTITNSGTFPQQFPKNPAFDFRYSRNVTMKNNIYKGKASKMIFCKECDKDIEFN